MSTTTTHKVHKMAHKLKDVINIAATSKVWNVVNHSGTDLVILDAFSGDPASTNQLYQCSLQLLPATDSKQALKADETKTISLGEPHTDSDGNPADYTIIIARADNLFPVKIVNLSAGADSFPDTVVTANDAKEMKVAENFVQTIIAFPSSDMAKAFANVLANADEEQIAALFQSYPLYTAINLEMIIAVQTYYNRYGFVWANYNNLQSYSLYTTNGTTTKKNLGTLTINNGTVAPVTNLDAPAGFTAIYMDAKTHKKTTLYYSSNQFSNDVVSSTPAICMQGLFILKSQLTGKDSDDLLMPVFYGTVNGNEIFGFTDSSTVSFSAAGGTSDKSGIAALLNPEGIAGWAKLSGAILGVILGFAALGGVAYLLYKRHSKARPLTPEEMSRAARQKAQDALSRLDPQLKKNLRIPDDLSVGIADVKKTATDRILRENKYKIGEILSNQSEMAGTLISYNNNGNLQKVVKSTGEDADVLDQDSSQLGEHMPALVEHITYNNQILNKYMISEAAKLTDAETATVSDSKKFIDENTGRVINNEKARVDLSEDEIPEIIED